MRLPLQAGDGALQLCETRKALVCLGLLPAKPEIGLQATQTALGSKAASALLVALRHMEPLEGATLTAAGCARDRERAEVNSELAVASTSWDCLPHFCRGSESLVKEFAKALRAHGWSSTLQSCSSQDLDG